MLSSMRLVEALVQGISAAPRVVPWRYGAVTCMGYLKARAVTCDVTWEVVQACEVKPHVCTCA